MAAVWVTFALSALGAASAADAGCVTDADCSYNGACSQSVGCVCDAAWKGENCGALQLLPTARTAGLRAVDDGENTSTWGGTVSLDNDTGLLHMWASEM